MYATDLAKKVIPTTIMKYPSIKEQEIFNNIR